MHMFGYQPGVATPEGVRRVVEFGGHGDALGITAFVLGLILWAAVVTALVLVIIYLIKSVRARKPGPLYFTPQAAAAPAPAGTPAVAPGPATPEAAVAEGATPQAEAEGGTDANRGTSA